MIMSVVMPLVLFVTSWVFSHQVLKLLLLSSCGVDVFTKMLVCDCFASDADFSLMIFKCVSYYTL